MAAHNGRPEPPAQEKRGLLKRMVSVPEGNVFIAGVLLAVLYMVAIFLSRYHAPDLSHRLLRMTGAHVFGGRAAGMTTGYTEHVPTWIVLVGNMVIETFMVLLCYPLFVFSYHKLIVIRPLEDAMQRIHETARAHQRRIVKYGVPGLLLFVWFPFWMTGPVVGAIIGFLIGLRPLVNLPVVLCGTYLAILGWGFLLGKLHGTLRELGPYVPIVFVGFIFLLVISLHIRYAFSRHVHAPDDDIEA